MLKSPSSRLGCPRLISPVRKLLISSSPRSTFSGGKWAALTDSPHRPRSPRTFLNRLRVGKKAGGSFRTLLRRGGGASPTNPG